MNGEGTVFKKKTNLRSKPEDYLSDYPNWLILA